MNNYSMLVGMHEVSVEQQFPYSLNQFALTKCVDFVCCSFAENIHIYILEIVRKLRIRT
jgi:hypothetical protein